jgi:uroporphyrinogen-III synthase
MPRAILLKTKSVPEDPYDTAFRDKTPLTPIFVPVLVHQRINEKTLRAILHNEPDKRYVAFIVTSQRAVEALDAAMAELTGMCFLGVLVNCRSSIGGPASNDGVYSWSSDSTCSYETPLFDNSRSGYR